MKKLKIFGFFLLTLIWFKIISYIAFFIYPAEVHQKYSTNINDLGAEGDIYQGQPFKIAIFGSSNLNNIGIKLTHTLGNEKVHIDQFIIGNYYYNSITSHMRTLRRLRRYYDIVWISFPTWSYYNEKRQLHYHFSNRWFTEEKLWEFPQIMIKFFNRTKTRENEPLLSTLENIFSFKSRKKEFPWKWKSQSKIKMNLKSLKLLTNFSPPPSLKTIDITFRKYNQDRIEKLIHSAKKIGNKIYFSPVRYIWHSKLPDDFYTDFDLLSGFLFSIIDAQYSSEKTSLVILSETKKSMKQTQQIWYHPEYDHEQLKIQLYKRNHETLKELIRNIMKAKGDNLYEKLNHLKPFHIEKSHLLLLQLIAWEHVWFDLKNYNLKTKLYKKLYQILKFINTTEINMMETKGVKIIDYSTHIENLVNNDLNRLKQLYIDSLHVNEEFGYPYIISLIAKEFRPLVEQKIKKSK